MESITTVSLHVTIKTLGNGLWSKVKKPVNITVIELIVCEIVDDYDENDNPIATTKCGSLHVHFDKSWDIEKDGLIYTDEGFLKKLKNVLSNRQIDASKLGYSEQGRQGDDYVDFDVDEAFIKSWCAKGWPFEDAGLCE